MYKTFEAAKEAAIGVVDRVYSGRKYGCVITETKFENEKRTLFNFRFHSKGTNGIFVRQEDGSLVRMTEIWK